MKPDFLAFYTPYLICSTERMTNIRLLQIPNSDIRLETVLNLICSESFTSKDLWKQVKPILRQIESPEGILIFDDTIIEHEWTEENEISCYHFDQSKNKLIKGINLLNLIYYHNDILMPLSFHIIKKEVTFCDIKTKQLKRKNLVTKNEILHKMFLQIIKNSVKFKYVLFDSWFGSKATFELIRKKKYHFISKIKDNRLIALSSYDKKKNLLYEIKELNLAVGACIKGWLPGYSHEVLISHQIIINKDGTKSSINLVCSDISLDTNHINLIYQKILYK